MKSFYPIVFILFLVLLIGCQQPQQQQTFTDADKEIVKKEVTEQFNQLVAALNQVDAEAWSKFYSKDEFVSAIVAADYYAIRSAWVDTVTNYFSMREKQVVEPVEVRVTALAPDLALMTSEEKGDMLLKNGANLKSKHVFTMIWKKEKEGWKILHSHESWIDTQLK